MQQTNTNQVFPILTKEQNEALSAAAAYERWGETEDGRIAVRFVTSWATTEEDADALCRMIEAL